VGLLNTASLHIHARKHKGGQSESRETERRGVGELAVLVRPEDAGVKRSALCGAEASVGMVVSRVVRGSVEAVMVVRGSSVDGVLLRVRSVASVLSSHDDYRRVEELIGARVEEVL